MDALDLAVLIALGSILGVVTTIAGLGGGLLIICVAAWFGPRAALSITAPALMVGHAHRVWLLRRELELRVVAPFVVSLSLVALAGSLLVVNLDESLLRLLLIPLSLVAIVELSRRRELEPRAPDRRWLIPGGVGVGVMLAGGGGGGVIAAPVLRRAGLRGDRMVAGLAAGAVLGHLARCLAYGFVGTLAPTSLLGAGVLAAALMLGNLGGRRLAARLGDDRRELLLRAVIAAALLTAVLQNL
jgi:uncharacterized membrane protein YfcA